jgi:hypothetical protein
MTDLTVSEPPVHQMLRGINDMIREMNNSNSPYPMTGAIPFGHQLGFLMLEVEMGCL